MPKTDVAAERATRLMEVLRQRREHGADSPLTVGRLRELADPTATDEELFKALAKAGTAVVLAAKKDAAAPVALAEDAESLARGDSLLTYALGKLATAERPLHAPGKVIAKVDKALQPAFEAALRERIASAALPPGVRTREAKGEVQLYLEQYPPPAPKKSAEQALAEQVLTALAGRREEGAPPPSLRELARRLDPPPAEETLAKVARHKALKGQAVFAAAGHLDAPLVRPGDEERLAQSPEALRFAVGLLSTPEQPLHPLSKVAGRLEKALRPAFEAAVRDQVENNALPAEVAHHAVGGKPHLRLARHELPPPPVDALAARLLAALEAAREAGDYPIGMDQLLTRVAGDAPPKLVKAALARVRDNLVEAHPGKPATLVALAADRGRLLDDPRLLQQAIEAVRTEHDHAVPLAGLGKKLGRELQADFDRSLEERAREGRLPPAVGCLWVKNKPHLFLRADVGRWPAPAPVAAPPAEAPPRKSDFDQVYERLAREPAAPVSLVQLRQEVPLGRDAFDSELERLCQTGRYALSGGEGAGVEGQADEQLYVWRRDTF